MKLLILLGVVILAGVTSVVAEADDSQVECEAVPGLSVLCGGGTCWNAAPYEYVDTPPAGYMHPGCCGDDAGNAFFGFMERYNFYRAGDYWTPSGADMSGSDTGDAMCCDHVDDCVYQGQCFDDDLDEFTYEVVIGGKEMTCNDGVWCPRYLFWNPTSGECEYPADLACYSNNPTYDSECESLYGSSGYHDDLWSSPSRDCYDTNTNEACCPAVDVSGAKYFSYANVVLY